MTGRSSGDRLHVMPQLKDDSLQRAISVVLSNEQYVILGDFNARVK